MTHDIAGLKQKITTIQDSITKLQDAKHAERLVPIIHRPGWTTIAEFELVQHQVDSLFQQVGNLHKGFDALVAIAEKIGKA